MDFENLARPNVRRMRPYVPGKPVEEIKELFGLEKVIKLASNENPLGPPQSAVEAMRRAAENAHFYPEGGSTRLRKAVALRYGLAETNVVIGSGSDELISLIARAFIDKGDEIVVSEHAFIRYKMAGELQEAKVVEISMDGFRHDLSAMKDAVTDRTKIVFIANPNNPTGTYNTEMEFSEFLDGLPRDKIVVMDEAYYEYARAIKDFPDSLGYWKKGHENLVILRTFSKAFALAGLRIGYGLAHPSIISQVDRIRPPFNLTSMSQAAAEAAFGDDEHVERTIKENNANMEWLCNLLESNGIDYVPSIGNFVLVKTTLSSQDVFEKLLSRGVIVRPMSGYGFPNHIRVTIGTREELEIFWKHFSDLENE